MVKNVYGTARSAVIQVHEVQKQLGPDFSGPLKFLFMLIISFAKAVAFIHNP